ncbi:hypothetical protein DXG01_004119 [Tephrocybe rancida]|nr:hypothetical protein DXG01_004119 [Tephrocybe rancida]
MPKPPAALTSKLKGRATLRTTTTSVPRKQKQAVSTNNESSSEEKQCPLPKRKARKKEVVVIDSDECSGSDEEDEVEIIEVGVLQEKRIAPVPSTHKVKKDSLKDLLLIFSDCVKVKFVNGQDVKEVRGRWCKICKVDENFIQMQGKCRAFHMGGNSSCCGHIRQHYKVYKTQCAEKNITENHWAILRNIWQAIEESKTDKKKSVQRTIEFEKVQPVKEFLREVVVDRVACLTAVDDQSLALANKAVFRNILVAMRPKATSADLPSTYDVKVHIHNEFVKWLKELKDDITEAPGKVSIMSDGWSKDKAWAAYLGTTAAWIQVKDVSSFTKQRLITPPAIPLPATQLKLFMNAVNSNGIAKRTSSHESLGHVVNLGSVDVMSHITNIGNMETATAIWEFDPTLKDNHVLGGSLDVVSAIRTLTIKTQSSAQ